MAYSSFTNQNGIWTPEQVPKRNVTAPVQSGPSQTSLNRYTNSINRVQKELGLNETQAQGFLNSNLVLQGNNHLNKSQLKDVNSAIDTALGKRNNRQQNRNNIARNNAITTSDKNAERYLAVAEDVQNKLGLDSKQADNYLSKFGKDGLTKEQAREVNAKLTADVEKKNARSQNKPLTGYNDRPLNNFEDRRIIRATREAYAEDALRTARKPYENLSVEEAQGMAFEEKLSRIKADQIQQKAQMSGDKAKEFLTNNNYELTDDNIAYVRGQINGYVDNNMQSPARNTPQHLSRKEEIINKYSNSKYDNIYDETTTTLSKRDQRKLDRNLRKQQKTVAKNSSNVNIPNNVDDFLNQNRKEILGNINEAAFNGSAPKSVVRKTAQETTEELTNSAGKIVGKNADDVAKQVSKFGKVGRIAAGLGVGAMVVSNMNKNKGQQTNGQLYGQQTPYGY